MLGQILAISVMFFITIGVTALFCLPILKTAQKDEIVRFYWCGLWFYLCGLVSLSGAKVMLEMAGQLKHNFAQSILLGVTCSFIFFVVFAWGRLALRGVKKLSNKSLKST